MTTTKSEMVNGQVIAEMARRWRAGESAQALAAVCGIKWQSFVMRCIQWEKSQGVYGSETESWQALADALMPTVEKTIKAEIAAARLPRPVEVRLTDRPVIQLDRVHRQFAELMELVAEGHKNILMVGPAGTGKTTLAESVAKAMSLDFAFLSLSAGVNETHIFGRILPQADGSWKYQASRFVQVYENGGIFLLDEVDAADPNVMVSINAALANGQLCNPVSGQIHKRHADCIIMAAANTFGRGGDSMYVGRNQLDAATLDRFVLATLAVNYDTSLEMDLAAEYCGEARAVELTGWVDTLRSQIAANRLRRVASTRLVISAAKAIGSGRTLAQVKARYFFDWSADEKMKVGA